MFKKILCAFGIGFMWLSPLHAHSQDIRSSSMQIQLVSGNHVIQATLNDCQAAQEFFALLPLTLTLNDYGGGIEKVTDLPRKLSTQGSPAGYTPLAGDIAYYAPWGNLAIFRRDFNHSTGLIKLGHIEHGLELLDRTGSIFVTIEAVK